MCMITFVPEGVQPDIKRILMGAEWNDDGHGFAIRIGDEIVVRRSFDSEYLASEFERMRFENPDGPAFFHSRMATHGTDRKKNIHPFYLGGDKRTVLAHNGIFSDLVVPKDSPRSDTRLFAEVFIPKHPKLSLMSRRGRARAAQWMGKYNKVAVITTNPNSRLSSFILNEESGDWDNGIWYSNYDYLGYKGYSAYTTGYTYPGRHGGKYPDYAWWEDDDNWSSVLAQREEKCEFCYTTGSISVTGICAFCRMCSHCGQALMTCQCK